MKAIGMIVVVMIVSGLRVMWRRDRPCRTAVSPKKCWGPPPSITTHDQIEAMTLGNRVAVLKDGELQQADRPSGCSTPRSTCCRHLHRVAGHEPGRGSADLRRRRPGGGVFRPQGPPDRQDHRRASGAGAIPGPAGHHRRAPSSLKMRRSRPGDGHRSRPRQG